MKFQINSILINRLINFFSTVNQSLISYDKNMTAN